MPISIQCPNPQCGAVASVPDAFSGRNVRCKKCETPFVATPTVSIPSQPKATESKNHLSISSSSSFTSLPAEFGRYRILKKLGQGGMGAVFQAEDRQLGRQVALKLPTFGPNASAVQIERFVREARSSAVLEHPNICTVFDAGEIDGKPFISMALIEGRELEEQIDPDAPMDEITAATLAKFIALALEHAHQQGIIHRDLKPSNVMITPDGEPVVMDFGLAKRLTDSVLEPQISIADSNPDRDVKLTQQGSVLGTPSYMSPEQVRGEIDQIGPTTDVYALGVILFEMLTGNTPYAGNLATIMGQILHAPVPPIAEFRPDIDPRLNEICQKAMSKNLGDRFQNMNEVAEALDAYLRSTKSSSVFAATRSQIVGPASDITAKADNAVSRQPTTKILWTIGILAMSMMLLLGVKIIFLDSSSGSVILELSDLSIPAEITLDGKNVDYKSLGQPLVINPGQHAISVKREGFKPFSMNFFVKDGELETVKLTLEPLVIAAKTPEKSPPIPITKKAVTAINPAKVEVGSPPPNLSLAMIKEIQKEPSLIERDFQKAANAPDSRGNAKFQNGYFQMSEGNKNVLHASSVVATLPDNFLLQARARQKKQSYGEWWLEFSRPGLQRLQLKLGLDRFYLQLIDDSKSKRGFKDQTLTTAKPSPPELWTEVTIIGRGKYLQCLLNDQNCTIPVELHDSIMGSQLRLYVWHGGESGTTPTIAEFESIKVWSLDNLPKIVPQPAPIPLPASLFQNPAPVVVASVADGLSRKDLSQDTLRFLSGDGLTKLPYELVGVLGSTNYRLPQELTWPSFTRDSKSLAVRYGEDVALMNSDTGITERIITLPKSPNWLHRILISPNGEQFACRFFPEGLMIGEVKTGKVTMTIPKYYMSHGQPFLPDGKGIMVTVGGNNEPLCLSTKDGKEIGKPNLRGGFHAFCPTPDGKEMIGVAGKKIVVFSPIDFKISRSVPFSDDSTYLTAQFDLKGQKLLVGSDHRFEVFSWPELNRFSGVNSPAAFATFDSTGTQVWATSHGVGGPPVNVWCYEALTGKLLKKLIVPGHSGYAYWTVSPDYKWIAGSSGNEGQRVCRINTLTGELIAPEIGHTNMSRSVAVSPDGRIAASGSADTTIRMWDLSNRKELACLRAHTGMIYHIFFSRDGKRFASIDDKQLLIVWSSDGKQLTKIQLTGKEHSYPTFTPDGSCILAGLADGRLGFYDSANGALKYSTGNFTPDARITVEFSPDGKRLAIGGRQSRVILVDASSFNILKTLPVVNQAWLFQFSEDGNELFILSDPRQPIQRWNIGSTAVNQLTPPFQVYGMSLQPKGGLLATSGAGETLTLVNTKDPSSPVVEIPNCVGKSGGKIAFTPDGKQLLSVGSNGLIAILRVPTNPEKIATWLAMKAKEYPSKK
jgi:serine/threonine protein kinase/WD40 repeat protein